MVKNQNYEEAAALQRKIDKLKQKSSGRNRKDFETKIKNLLEQLIKKHKNDLKGYKVKLETERNQISIIRAKEIESLHSKFKVIRDKLFNNQKAEFNYESKKLKCFKPSSNYILNHY